MAISYEWDIEESDEYGDIVDHDFRGSLSEYGINRPAIDGERLSLVLVRNTLDKYGDLREREWAYATQQGGRWILHEDFQDAGERPGAKVPKRFRDELAAWAGNK